MTGFWPALKGHAILASLLFAVALPPAAFAADDPPATSRDVTLTLLHDNDLHGHLLPFAYTEIGRSSEEMPSVGGAARRATLIRRLRAEAKNPVFLIDTGDTFTRGPFTSLWEGIADTEAMNAIGYELAAVGNNEFKAKDASEQSDAAASQAALLRVFKRSRFPWVCANVTDDRGAFLEGVQPFVVRQFGPLRVGFLGLVTGRVGGYPQAKGWHVADPIETAKVFIPLARRQCDVLIAVTHIGVDDDKKLAAQTTGLDAIVGGDSHTFLYQPVTIKNADGSHAVPVVQDGEFGVDLGKFDLHFTRNEAGQWSLADFHDELLPVAPNLAEARDVADVIAPYYAPLATVVGKLPADRIGATPEARNRLSTQVWMDALRRQTGADFAINPAGGGFFDGFRSPAVRRYDIYAAEPFRNTAVTTTMTGAQIKALIASRTDNVVSGGDTAALDDTRTFKVALIDFVAATYYHLPAETLTATGKDVRDLLIADFQTVR